MHGDITIQHCQVAAAAPWPLIGHLPLEGALGLGWWVHVEDIASWCHQVVVATSWSLGDHLPLEGARGEYVV